MSPTKVPGDFEGTSWIMPHDTFIEILMLSMKRRRLERDSDLFQSDWMEPF